MSTELREMITAWNTIVETALKQFPHASEEEIYQIAKSAMNHALKLT